MGDSSEGTRTITTPAAPLAHHLDSRPFGSPPSLSLDITRVSLLGVKLDECARLKDDVCQRLNTRGATAQRRRNNLRIWPLRTHQGQTRSLVNFGNRLALIPRGGREGGGSKNVFSLPLFALYVCIQLCVS